MPQKKQAKKLTGLEEVKAIARQYEKMLDDCHCMGSLGRYEWWLLKESNAKKIKAGRK